MEQVAVLLSIAGWLALSLTTVFIASVVLLVTHELGHLLAAVASRSNVHTLNIGGGPLAFERRVGQTHVVIRKHFWAHGYVMAVPRTEGNFKLRQIIFFSSGCAAEIALFVLVYAVVLSPSDAVFQATLVPSTLALVSQVWSALKPGVANLDGMIALSDGAQILQVWKNGLSEEDRDAFVLQYQVDELIRERRLGDLLPLVEQNLQKAPRDCRALGLFGIGLIGRNREAEAIQPLRDSLQIAAEENETSEVFLAQTEANLAHCLLLTADGSRLKEALFLSQVAAQRIRRDALDATLGAAHVMAGELATGLQLLENAKAIHDDEKQFRLLFLGIAVARRGDLGAAETMAVELRGLNNPSFERRLAELEAVIWPAHPEALGA